MIDPLDPGRLGTDCVVEREWAIKHPAGDLPAIRHFAQRGGIDRRWDARVHRLDGRQNGHLRCAQPQPGVEIDGVLNDVALRHEIRRDVHRGVRDEQRLRMGRNIHDKNMTDASPRAQPGLPLRNGPKELIRMETSFHQQLGLARSTSSTALSAAVWLCGTSTISTPATSRPQLAATLRILSLGPTRMGNDHSLLGRFQCPSERALVTGVGDGRRQRRQVLGRRDEALVLLVLAQLRNLAFWVMMLVLSEARAAPALRLTTSG